MAISIPCGKCGHDNKLYGVQATSDRLNRHRITVTRYKLSGKMKPTFIQRGNYYTESDIDKMNYQLNNKSTKGVSNG